MSPTTARRGWEPERSASRARVQSLYVSGCSDGSVSSGSVSSQTLSHLVSMSVCILHV